MEVAERVQSFAPTTKILFCSHESSPDVVREALRLGFGYVHKLEAGIDLLPAFNAVLSGRRFVSSNLEPNQAITVSRTTPPDYRVTATLGTSKSNPPGRHNGY
jgi:DNA-binding NarL/FixJ family response regulator